MYRNKADEEACRGRQEDYSMDRLNTTLEVEWDTH